MHTLHGLYPASIAFSRLLNSTRLHGAMFYPHSQSGWWKTFDLALPTYTLLSHLYQPGQM